MNKKGLLEGSEFPTWLLQLAVLTAIIIFLSAIIIKYRSQDLNIPELQTEILTFQLLYSCLVDEPGIINIEKFTENNIKNCIKKEKIGFQLTLKDLNNNIIKNQDEKNALILMDLIQKSKFDVCTTMQDSICYTKEQLVNYKMNNEIETGILKIEVILPNA